MFAVKTGMPSSAPAPYGTLPSRVHALWYATTPYALVHFSMGTFVDKEWGYGDEAPAIFNPSAFDAGQWARSCRDAGLKGLVVVGKHHDGFCLWPTQTTGHSVRNSPWRGGKGDVLAEVAAACRESGLKFGVYCSLWDRNHPEYGRPAYVKILHQQIREMMSKYGSVFMLWIDGAGGGGEGYYGGAYGRRPIAGDYYEIDTMKKIVHSIQPDTEIFEHRFGGNECGFVKETCWATFDADDAGDHGTGVRHGKIWQPAECDFPLRKGWFFHPDEDIKQPDKLVELYFKSIGRGAAMTIGLAPDPRGLIHEDDVAVLKEWRRRLDEIFKTDILRAVPVTVSSDATRGRSPEFAPANVIDGNPNRYWAAADDVAEPALVFDFAHPVKFNVVELEEYVALGQRIDAFAVEIWQSDGWHELASATSVGYKRLLMVRTVQTDRVRLRFTQAAAAPVIAKVGFYLAPASMVLDAKITIVREREGNVAIRCRNDGLAIRYTTDGSEPTATSCLYVKPFPLPAGGTVKAVGFVDDARTPLVSATFGCDRSGWRVVRVSLDSPYDNRGEAGIEKLLDDNPDTYWHTYHSDKTRSAPPHEVVLDMGHERQVAGLTLMPHLGGDFGDDNQGTPDQYEFHLSRDDKEWTLVAQGEFANIKANPCMQLVRLAKPVTARYVRFVAKHVVNDGDYVVVAGIGIVEAGKAPNPAGRQPGNCATTGFLDAAAFGFSPAASGMENTRSLQQAVDQGGTITVCRPGTYKMAGTVYLGSDTTLLFGSGTRLMKVDECGNFTHVLLNKGALTRTYDQHISVEGLHLVVNGVFKATDEVPGLRGQIAFFYIKDLRIARFRCLDVAGNQYSIHICTFEDVIVDDVIIKGDKDGVHFGRGRHFTVRNGVFQTYDDAIALNGHDYASGNPEIGWIEDGVVENCHDLADDKNPIGFFCRLLAGGWIDWREGMEVQNSDAVVSNGRIYRVHAKPDGTVYKSMTRPTHDKGAQIRDGINWIMAQTDAIHTAGVRNVVFRDIFLEKPRIAFSLNADNDAYSRSYYPEAEAPMQEHFLFDNVRVLHDGCSDFLSVNTPVDVLSIRDSSFKNNRIYFHGIKMKEAEMKTRINLQGCVFNHDGEMQLLTNDLAGKVIKLKTAASIEVHENFSANVSPGCGRITVESDLTGLKEV